MKRTIIQLLIALSVLAIFAGSCRREFGNPTWEVDGLVPILRSKISIQQLVQDSIISANQDGDQLTLKYAQNLFTLKLDSIFSLPDTVNSQTFSIPLGPINFAPGQVLKADTTTTTYGMNGVQLLEIDFRSGKLWIEVINNIEEALVVSYSIPSSQKDGIPFSFSKIIPAGSFSNPQIIRDTFDLTGYNVNLQGKQLNTYNTITALYSVIVDPNGSLIAINSGDYVSFNTSFIDVVPELATGYFENQTIAVDPQFALADFFTIFKSGSMAFENPKVRFTIQNEIGMDISANDIQLSGTNTQTKNTISLQAPAINQLSISRAFRDQSNDPPIRPTKYSVELNETNANLNEFISNFPDQINYQASLEVNPLGNISGYNDFIYFNTGLKLGLEIDIPMRITANELVIADTVEFVFTEDSLYQNITNGNMNILVKNRFPFSVTPSLVFVDENGTAADTLLAPNYEVPSQLNDWEIVPIKANQEVLEKLYSYKKMLIVVKLNTVEQSTTLFANYTDFVEIQLVLDAGYQLGNR